MNDFIKWIEEHFLPHLRHHADPVANPSPATPLPDPPKPMLPVAASAPPAGAVGTSSVGLAPPAGSPLANLPENDLTRRLLEGQDAAVPRGLDVTSAATAAPAEDRNTGVVDRAGSPRYWRAPANQQARVLVPVAGFTGLAMEIDISGDATEAGTEVESFTAQAIVAATGAPLTDVVSCTRIGKLSVPVSSGDFYVVVTPATSGAGFVQRIA